MQKTLMEGLNEKDMQAVIRTYDLKPYYYPTLFPLKETNLLTWKGRRSRRRRAKPSNACRVTSLKSV